MEVLYPRCAGLDVHQKTVVACARVVGQEGVAQHVETFETTTQGLEKLRNWLLQFGCTHVAMESTGVYWKPVWHVLEGAFSLVLAHAGHVRNVPGRKTDVNDAMWIADLLAHGLIRGSFTPPTPVQELRDLTRTRKQLVREIAQHTLRLQKTLEDANLKITGLISDLLGQSGRALLMALIAGETDPEQLVRLTSGRLKAPRAQLVEALRGRVHSHHRFLLKLHLDQIDALQQAVREVEEWIGESTAPYREAVELLDTIPGVNPTAAHVILAEIGLDMARFPSAAHLISWAGLLPPQRRECWQASLHPRAKRCALAQDHVGAGGLGCRPQERLVPESSVPAHQGPTRRHEGHPCRRRFHAHRHLPHASHWRRLRGPRSALLRHPRPSQARPPLGPTPQRPWRAGRTQRSRLRDRFLSRRSGSMSWLSGLRPERAETEPPGRSERQPQEHHRGRDKLDTPSSAGRR